MQNKIVFREMLGELRELADKQDNYLTKEEVRQFFSEGALSEEQLDLVCEYLVSQKIKVEGYQKKEKTEQSADKNRTEETEQKKEEPERPPFTLKLNLPFL